MGTINKKPNKYSLLHLSNTRFAKSNLRLLSYNAKLKDEIKKLKLIDKDKPKDGKVYSLTGAKGTACIANGNTWKESEVKDD